MITIIGSGLAGYTLVRELRKLDKTQKISVITQDNGDYYSKPQLSTAITHHKSLAQLVLIPSEKFAEQFDIDLKTHTDLSDLSMINYSDKSHQIILALGAQASLLPVLSQNSNLYSVNNLNDYKIFREALDKHSLSSVTVIGAGLVGCEFANDLIAGGYKVNLIAPESYLLAKLVPESVGRELEKALAERGVKFYLNQFFDDSRHHKLYPDNIILSAIGLKPNILLAQNSGISTGEGIIVNNYLRTNLENIFALGDCAQINGRVTPYVGPIAIGARALAQTLLGKPALAEFPPLPIFIKTSFYPVVVLPPKEGESGEWHSEIDKASNLGENVNSVRALFYNNSHQLKGFALGGNFASEANEWIKKV